MKKFEVGPPAAKRHVGKQKPVVVDDGSSKRKKVIVFYPSKDDDDFDRVIKELNLPDDDEPKIVESKSAPARSSSKQYF